MAKKTKKISPRDKRKASVRKKIQGSPEKPRLCVFRSLKYTYAQLIDDGNSKVLLSVSSKDLPGDNSSKSKGAAKEVGKKVAELAKEKEVDKVVFDRNGYLYHGRVAAVAEGAREGGLNF